MQNIKNEYIHDLSAQSSSSHSLFVNVCIIGAGPAGLYLSSELKKRNINNIIIEAGSIVSASYNEIGFEAKFEKDHYSAATLGRYFGLGGTSTRWGGALIPYSQFDQRYSFKNKFTWDSIIRIVNKNSKFVLANFGYKYNPNFNTYANNVIPDVNNVLLRAGINLQANLILPYNKKNLVELWLDNKSIGISNIYINAVACKWDVDKNSKELINAKRLMAVSKNGKILFINASQFVIAAGALESVRVLLEINNSTNNELFSKNSMIGRGLSDHLSVSIADVNKDDNKKVVHLFAPHFEKSWMRSFRFIPANNIDEESTKCFAHFIFEQDNFGFKLAKKILSSIQLREPPNIDFNDIYHGVGSISKLAFSRFYNSRLYVPADANIRLQLDIEQSSSFDNKVYLDKETDEFGRNKLKIDWTISDYDLSLLGKVADKFLEIWPYDNNLLPRLIRRNNIFSKTKPHDAYHPVGTCRIGTDDCDVVDLNLKLKKSSNIWVLTTGILPSAGTANPTFSILCLAHELAEVLQHV